MSAAYFFMVWEEAVGWAHYERVSAPLGVGCDLMLAVLRRRTTPDFASAVRAMGEEIARGAAVLDEASS